LREDHRGGDVSRGGAKGAKGAGPRGERSRCVIVHPAPGVPVLSETEEYAWGEKGMQSKQLNEISHKIIGRAIEVHKIMGPGLLESIYQKCLIMELEQLGFFIQTECDVPIVYKGNKINDEKLRIDMIVDHAILLELKSVEEVKPVHAKQLLTYLRLTKMPLGLLINFNTVRLVDGIQRIVNDFPEGA
jgi:GxxExxY protein